MPTVKDIFKITKGKKVSTTVEKSTGNSVRYIQIGDLRNDLDLKYTEENHLISVTESDTVVAWDGAYAGLVGFGLNGIIGSTLARLSLNELYTSKYEPRYLGYFLKSKFKYLQSTCTGAAIPHVSKKALEKIDIPITKLQTQRQVVTALDKAQAILNKRKQSIELLDELLQATFLDMFGDPISSKKYGVVRLSEYLEKIQIGPFGSQLHRSDYVKNSIPLINPVNILDKKIIPDNEITIRESKYNSLSNYHLKKGDIIMARRGEMGKCGLITEKEDGWFCGTGSLYLRPKDTRKAIFLLHSLTNPSTVSYLNHNAKGVTMKNLNKSIISNIPIIACPIEEIMEFGELVNSYEKLRLKLNENYLLTEELFQSTLQRAFHGDLSFDLDLQLDAFLESEDLKSISEDSLYIERLVERFNQHNGKNGTVNGDEKPFSFESFKEYNKAKNILFGLLKENKVVQVYNKQDGKTVLEMP